MTDAQHMAFTRQFGELEFNPAKLIEKQYGVETQTSGRRGEIPPEISVISNIVEDGKAIGGLGDGEAFWHTDFVVCRCAAGREPVALVSNARRPPPAARPISSIVLRLRDAAGRCQRRIDGLTRSMPRRIRAAARRIRASKRSRMFRKCRARGSRWCAPIPRPAGSALFLGRRINAYVIGLPVAESEALLDFLWEHTKQERFTWKQEWQVGDLVWWDNRCAMHRRDAFDPAARRLMHRTQLKGTGRSELGITPLSHCGRGGPARQPWEGEGIAATPLTRPQAAAAATLSRDAGGGMIHMQGRICMPHPTRVALITGCGKPVGIGNSTARALAAKGVAVVVSDLRPTGVANEFNAPGDTDANWGGVDSLVEADRARPAAPPRRRSAMSASEADAGAHGRRGAARATAGSTSWSTTPARRRAPTATRSRTCRSPPGT